MSIEDILAHTVCILKSSKLNYLVEETPYSAFVTIRKRFVKDVKELPSVTLSPDDGKENHHNLKRDNLILKQKCKSLEVEAVS